MIAAPVPLTAQRPFDNTCRSSASSGASGELSMLASAMRSPSPLDASSPPSVSSRGAVSDSVGRGTGRYGGIFTGGTPGVGAHGPYGRSVYAAVQSGGSSGSRGTPSVAPRRRMSSPARQYPGQQTPPRATSFADGISYGASSGSLVTCTPSVDDVVSPLLKAQDHCSAVRMLPGEAPDGGRSSSPKVTDEMRNQVRDSLARFAHSQSPQSNYLDTPGGPRSAANGYSESPSGAATSMGGSTIVPSMCHGVGNVVLVRGPDGRAERLRVTVDTTPHAVDLCLRGLFNVSRTAGMTLRDPSGCAIPLDGALLVATAKAVPDAVFKLELCEPEGTVNPDTIEKKRKHVSAEKTGKFTRTSIEDTVNAAEDECRFWTDLAARATESTVCRTSTATSGGVTVGMKTVRRQMLRPETPWGLEDGRPRGQYLHVAAFDTSQHRTENLYASWVDGDGDLHLDVLLEELAHEGGMDLSEGQLQEALQRVTGYLHSKRVDTGTGGGEDGVVSLKVFTHLWQRLMLGAVCSDAMEGGRSSIRDPDVRVFGYNERTYRETTMSEQDFFFGGNLLFKGHGSGSVSCWARIDNGSPDHLLRMGVKFFLHPIAIEEAISAAKERLTKVDVYRQQYFASLETYALTINPDKLNADGTPPKVHECIIRSTIFLVATGNPKKRYRDWVLTIVESEQYHTDPFDRFQSGPRAGVQVLDGVKSDLRAHGRAREHQADFLLYTVIDRATSELVPICKAYGHRLNWLQAQLDERRRAVSTAYVDEVSKMRLELQELQQWVGQLRGVIRHLEVDCKGVEDGRALSLTFGSNVHGSGKSLLLFLRGTQESLDRSSDRLKVLDELAQTFAQDHQRHRDVFMNRTLFALTISTAIFLPAQLLAGVYGMNFQDAHGNTTMPELKMKHGYLFFWIMVISLLSLAALVLYCVLLTPSTGFHRVFKWLPQWVAKLLPRLLRGTADSSVQDLTVKDLGDAAQIV